MDDHTFTFPGGSTGVLLIHGLGGTPAEMKHLGKGLARGGFTVYGMQLAGHCGSEADLMATNWQDWYASVEAAHDHLAKSCSTIFVAGLSMGAVLALHLAAHRPAQVTGLGLLSITLKYDGWSVPRLNFLLPYVLRLPYGKNYRFPEMHPYGIKDERLRQIVVKKLHSGASEEAGLLSTPGVSIREMYRLVAEVRRELPHIRTPALVIHALEDDIASARSNALYLQAHLGGPVELVLLDDCYHVITVDKQRQEVLHHTVRFFTTLSPQPASATGGPVASASATLAPVTAHPQPTPPPVVQAWDSIAKLDRAAWDHCLPGVVESYDYYLAAEEAGIPHFHLRYLTVTRGGQVLAVAPAFLVDYRLDTTVQGAWKNLSEKVFRPFPWLITIRLACLGSPVSEVCDIGFAPEVTRPERAELLGLLLDGLERLARQQGRRLTGIKDLPEMQADLWTTCRQRGYRQIPGLPTAVLALPHADFDGYLASLSRNTRKDILHKLRTSQAIRCEQRQQIDDVLPQVMALYEETLTRSQMQFERLPAAYFQNVLRRQPGIASCFLYWAGDQLVAFNLVLENEQVLVDKFLGMHYPVVRQYNLYFLSWMTNVRHAISRGIPCYQSGQAGYGPKLRLGSTLIPNWIFFRHRQPLCNAFLRVVSQLVRVDRHDATLRPAKPKQRAAAKEA